MHYFSNWGKEKSRILILLNYIPGKDQHTNYRISATNEKIFVDPKNSFCPITNQYSECYLFIIYVSGTKRRSFVKQTKRQLPPFNFLERRPTDFKPFP